MQRFYFKDGKMKYSARYLQSETYQFHKSNERVVIDKHGYARKLPDPCKVALGPLSTQLLEDGISDNASINFITVGDTVWAAAESTILHQIDPKTLDTIGKVNIRDIITLNSFTAHQQYDHDGNIYHIGVIYGQETTYVFAVTKNPKNFDNPNLENPFTETSIIGTIPATDEPSYFHSFGMTDNYIIAFESPLKLNLHSDDFTNLDCLFWKKDTPVNIRVLDKRTGKEIDQKFCHAPFFAFHHANAYEKDGCLVVDYCQFSQPDLHMFDLKNLRKGSLVSVQSKDEFAYGSRMIIPVNNEIINNAKIGDDLLKDKEFANGCTAVLKEKGIIWLEHKILSDIAFEFPRYNLNYNLKPYNYIYGSILLGMPETLDGLVKVNVETGKTISWIRDHKKQIATEPIFVPHPEAKDEDDGLILAPVITFEDNDFPFVVILDAKTFTEVARCKIDHPLPLSFHAQFYPN
jgi:beta-carotene 15,15'-monooxygenase